MAGPAAWRYREYRFGLWAVLHKDARRVYRPGGPDHAGLRRRAGAGNRLPVPARVLAPGVRDRSGARAETVRVRYLGAQRVYSIIRDTNIASQKVAMRNGMLPVHQFVKHYYGVDMPHIVYCAQRG